MTEQKRQSTRQLTRRDLLGATALAPVAAGLGIAGINTATAQERGIVGKMAPELDCEFWIDGKGEPTTFSLNEQRGKWVYMKFWQSWCPGCHSAGFPALQHVTEAFKDEDRVVTLAIQTVFEGHDFNSGDKVRETQLRYELEIPFAHDPGSKTESGYPNTMIGYLSGGTPWQVIVAPDGTVVYDGFRVDAAGVVEYFSQELKKMG